MNALHFELAKHVELVSVSAVFTPGTHVVLGHERDGTHTLVSLAAGMAPPSAGRVHLNGAAPFSNALLRRDIGALCATEALPPARTVERALALALRARGDARPVTRVLSAAGLAHLTERCCATLSTRETRAVALAIALAHPKPSLLALHEPLSLVPLVREEFILDALHEAAESGVIVLATASRLEDASRLGGTASALERGIWLPAAGARTLTPGVTLRVQTPHAARLVTCLAEAADIDAVTWAGTQELLVRGSNLERVAQRVVSSARADAIHITALRQEFPALEAASTTPATTSQPAPPGSPQ
ncbi:MAG: ATP-binding cassette domain-containing protein [Pseudomonadota bacterium]